MNEVLLLPGMGADARLFAGLSGSASFTVPRWPQPLEGDSLQDFAARLASTVRSSPLIVGGVSFGGMVAVELAAIVRPRAVILIGSCSSPSSLARHLQVLGRAAVCLPDAAFRPRPRISPLLLPKFGELDAAQRQLFWSMASSTSGAFIRWACSAILRWLPCRLTTPVFHLHGARDRLIPIHRVQPTEVVPNGGHLLPLTHPDLVSSFVERVQRAVA